MKLRTGFVSNSSTSSFIIVGAIFDNQQEFIDALKPEALESIKNDEDYKDNIEDFINDNGFTFYGDNSFGWGTRLGSIDYIDEIASLKDITSAFKSEEKSFNEMFKDELNIKPSLIGIRVDC